MACTNNKLVSLVTNTNTSSTTSLFIIELAHRPPTVLRVELRRWDMSRSPVHGPYRCATRLCIFFRLHVHTKHKHTIVYD
jgi:hypothetical protein